MSAAEFLAWNAPGRQAWQLIDGEPVAMAPASRTHGAIQTEIGRLIGNHLLARNSRCSVVTAPGVVPRIRSSDNLRIPDLAVTCAAYDAEEHTLEEPVLLIEILSPSNRSETWTNVWAYTTIPSVQEILVVRAATIGAELLRRGPDGSWPEQPVTVTDGELELASIGFRTPLVALYRTTRLAAR